jgi:hypothetical protein
MVWNLEGTKVAVLVGDHIYIFDAQTKAHESSFSIRGNRGVPSNATLTIRIDWNGEEIFVEAILATHNSISYPIWVFKPDGTALGPLEALGGNDKAPLSTENGSFLLLDANRVAISEQGMSTLTIYEIETGKRSKLVRKVPAPGGACTKDELDAFWRGANISATCKDFFDKNYAHLIYADAVAGTKNLLVLLRGPRLGEVAVLDASTLDERKVIKMPWCEAAPGGGPKQPAAPPAAGSGAQPVQSTTSAPVKSAPAAAPVALAAPANPAAAAPATKRPRARGPNLTPDGVVFVFKPETIGKKKIFLSGTFNNWNPADPRFLMTEESNGTWSITVKLAPGTYQYKFVADGQWIKDPYSPSDAPDGFDGRNGKFDVK